MRQLKSIRKLGRRARALFQPIPDPKTHLCDLIRRTGKDLGFDQRAIESLVIEASLTILESWTDK